MAVHSKCEHLQFRCLRQCPRRYSLVSITESSNCRKYDTHFQHSHWQMYSSCVALNIRLNNELSATFHCISCDYKDTPTPQYTPALTLLTTRYGTRSKYNQALAAHSEVTFTRRPITVSRNVQFSSPQAPLPLPPQCCATEVSGLLHNNVSKHWLCTRVRYIHNYANTQLDVDLQTGTGTI